MRSYFIAIVVFVLIALVNNNNYKNNDSSTSSSNSTTTTRSTIGSITTMADAFVTTTTTTNRLVYHRHHHHHHHHHHVIMMLKRNWVNKNNHHHYHHHDNQNPGRTAKERQQQQQEQRGYPAAGSSSSSISHHLRRGRAASHSLLFFHPEDDRYHHDHHHARYRRQRQQRQPLLSTMRAWFRRRRMAARGRERRSSVLSLSSSSSSSSLSSFYNEQQECPTGRNVLSTDSKCLVGKEHLTVPLGPDLDHIETSLLPSSPSNSDNSVYVFPLVVQPKNYTSNFCLRLFMKYNGDWIDEQILNYGAVLFRGFDITSAKEVEDDIIAFEGNRTGLSNQYRGTSPRTSQDNTTYIFSAAEVPTHFPIAQHLEMSFLYAPPKRLFFSALQAPKTARGGETALTDFRKVYRDIPIKLRNKLQQKKLKYIRTHHKYGTPSFLTNDVSALKSWIDVFGTNDKSLVERISAQEGMPMRWVGKNNDTYISEYTSEPFQLHPQTKQPVWFNHAQVFHWSTYPAELLWAFRRTRDIRYLLRSISSFVTSVITYVLLRKRMSLHVTYGDGTSLSLVEMSQIRSAIHRNMIFNQWKNGDLLMIDNFSTSHGREPTYDKGRKIVVAWSNPIQKTNDLIYGAGTGVSAAAV